MNTQALECAFEILASIARRSPANERQALCTAVANIIVAAGREDLANAMHAAERAGFMPEFYPGAVRVTWPEG